MEELLHFVWKHRLWLPGTLVTHDGRKVDVLDPGQHNHDSGPDFFNASIQIGNETWAGNVEIHVRASDWFRHHHDTDPAYHSVVLHVVSNDDCPVHRPDGSVIPQVTLRCSAEAARRCNQLMGNAAASLPCANTLRALPSIYHTDWLTALALERLYEKSERITSLVADTGGYWEAAAYITLARALGFGLNSQPFELLAKNLPLRFLNRHADELPIVEAMLFGQAGLLPQPLIGEHPYITQLRTNYTFFAHKFSLKPLPLNWKMARTRPQNFPHRRIALLAHFIARGFEMFNDIAAAGSDLEAMRGIFSVNLTGFWATHFTFAPTEAEMHAASPRAISRASADILIINVVAPLLHARALHTGNYEAMEQAVDLLQKIAPENNQIVRLFQSVGLNCPDALTSQAMVQLRRQYCEKHKCIYCRFGHRMLSAEIAR